MPSHATFRRKVVTAFTLLAALVLLLSAESSEAARASTRDDAGPVADLVPRTEDGQVPILVTGADGAALVSAIEALSGRVTQRFDNIDAVAATLPPEALPALRSAQGVDLVERQRFVRRAVSPSALPDPVAGSIRGEFDGEVIPLATSAAVRTEAVPLSAGHRFEEDGESGITSFLGYDHITGAAESWEAADYGQGTIVSVIDTGIYPSHPLYAGNVIGGINLVPSEEEMQIDHTGDGVPDGASFDWDAVENHYHGSFVSGMVAGHMDLILPEDDPFVLSVALHSPESVEFYGDGTAGIHLMGTAPGASLFAVKVFPYDGGNAPDARVVEAIDHLITMRLDGTLETDVINMSLSGPVLNDGRNALDRIVDAATAAGITVVSAAANQGPALTSVGSPGSAITSLTAGGAIDPIHTRVAIESLFGAPPGTGNIIYPTDDPLIVDFSSRGLTADNRVKPDIIATGFLTFSALLVDLSGDGLNDTPSFGFGSGTSFSTPTIAGAAALVTAFARKERGQFAGPPYVANALRRGASPIHEYDEVSQREQGRGFVNLPQAFDYVRRGQVHSPGPVIKAHHAMRQLSVASGQASGVTGLLEPGMSYNFLIDVPENIGNLAFEITGVTLGGDQNPFLGDGMTVTVHSAKRGGNGDYIYGSSPVQPGETFNYDFPEPGTVRLTVLGNFTNYSPGSVAFEVTAEPLEIPTAFHFDGRLEKDEIKDHVVEVPDGLEALAIRLSWKHDWTRFPTYDLDMYIDGPGDDYFVGSLDSPEGIWIEDPEAGDWTLYVIDAGTVERREPYEIDVALIPGTAPARGGRLATLSDNRPKIGLEMSAPGPGETLRLNVPEAGPVRLRVFDVTGRLVRTLTDRPMEAGEHLLRWDGASDSGSRLGSGIYFVRLDTAAGVASRKLLLH